MAFYIKVNSEDGTDKLTQDNRKISDCLLKF